MRKVLSHFVISIVSLYIVSQIAQGLVFANGVSTLAVTGVVLTLTSLLGKPIINVLLLPLNLVTFGVFRWVSSALSLYITTLILQDFKVEYFLFSGYQNTWFDLPQLSLNGFMAYVGFAFVLSVITSSLHWVFKG